tara:strand:+ start:128 stop:610 length:483 start_codon:yes stop_codon:yes gene_type:complete
MWNHLLIQGVKPFDVWTLIHMILGIIVFIILKYFKLSFWSIFIIGNIIHFIYEIKDYIIHYHVFKNNIPYMNFMFHKIKNKYNLPFIKFMLGEIPPNNFLNSVFDQIGFASGIIIANLFIKNIPRYVSLFFIGLFLSVYSMKFINMYFFYKNNYFNALQD